MKMISKGMIMIEKNRKEGLLQIMTKKILADIPYAGGIKLAKTGWNDLHK